MRQVFKIVMAAVLVALLCLGSVGRGFAQGGAGRPFITKWQGKAGEALKIPIVGTDYKLVIKNEKGEVVKTEEKVTVTGEDDSYYHPFTPSTDGVYTVEAGPAGVKYMRMKAEWKIEEQKDILFTSNDKLLEVVQFGTVVWESMSRMFDRCSNMTFAASIDTPDLMKVTDMSFMFAGCTSFNEPLNNWNVSQVTDMSFMFAGCTSFNEPLNNWNVSQVTDMSGMFRACRAFNQPLNNWDVSKVTKMSEMFIGCTVFNEPLNNWNVSEVTDMRWIFYYCRAFNQPLNNWDVSKVTDMSDMFYKCEKFNQPLNNWDVSKVTNMGRMFYGCTAFNQPLEKWDVSKVTSMSQMFGRCSAFNQPLNNWAVSKVTNMSEMFYYCSAFNQPLNNWDVSKVTNMSGMFERCSAFNQPLNNWDVSKVTNMSRMFYRCEKFNQPLNNWDVSKVTNMSEMFYYCSVFNQPLEKWDVSKVTSMSQMFNRCEKFNQPLEKWDVSKVTNMEFMFSDCTAFNQPLEKWNVSNVASMVGMFERCSAFNQPLGAWKLQTSIGGLSTTAMSVVNYSLSLIGWAKQTDGASNIDFRWGIVEGLVYNDAGKEAREKLIARGWTFKGDVYKPSEKFAISLAKEGEGTLAIEGYNDEGLKAVAEGTELMVIATPKEGYTLTSLTAGSQNILATKKFTVKEAVTVKAVFKKKVSITLAKEGEGTLAIEGYNDEGLKAVAEGTELTVIATPKKGYKLTSLTAGAQDILATKKFTVTGAVTVKAVFKEIEKVSITLAKEGEGTLAIESYNEEALQAVAEGTELTVIATPKEGYMLTSLTAGTQDILATKKFTVKGAVTVKAVFKKKVAITLDKEGEGTLTIEGYNDEALKAVAVGTELTVVATPKEGYTLTSLTAGTQDILATKKFTVTGAVTVKAVFKKKVSITLAKEGEGTLAIEGYNEEALQAVVEGTELTVIATPKEGYTLTSLMAGTQDILETKKFTVKEAVTVKAVFTKNGDSNPSGGNNGGGNNGGGNNGGGTWQPQTPKAVEDAVLASLAVAPNPFTSQLRIENPEGVEATYELVNASGLVVRSGAFSATEVIVDTEVLPAGVYFVRIEAQNGAKRVEKVVKY